MIRILENYILKKYKAVSFDVFDTLIERNVRYPELIFIKVGEKLFDRYRTLEFYHDRILAEKKAREKRTDGEVRLDEIYAELNEKYGKCCDRLKELEIEAELNSCHRKKEVYRFYRRCIKNGKKIYFVSDMYLPVDIIKSMLRNCGITKYNGIYVSGEYRVNKKNGELFEKLLEEDDIEKKDIIHIGDSAKADYFGPRRVGVKSVLIGRKNWLGRLLHKYGNKSIRSKCR